VPAIAGEGRALHEAAADQGIAGVMARQRSSPYLPGVRSRLWRFIAVGPAVVPATPDQADMAPDAEPSTTASAPVVALIRRLPLLFDE
jgi:hypothetical protein